MRTGDLIATGTISSPESLRPDPVLAHNASLWELSWDGTKEVPFVGGTFIEDGDEVTFDGWARGKNGRMIGFGELVNRVVSPVPL
jgi:fumarylacetoacetase